MFIFFPPQYSLFPPEPRTRDSHVFTLFLFDNNLCLLPAGRTAASIRGTHSRFCPETCSTRIAPPCSCPYVQHFSLTHLSSGPPHPVSLSISHTPLLFVTLCFSFVLTVFCFVSVCDLQDAAHCRAMQSSRDNDPADVKAARLQSAAKLAEWLAM